MAGILSRDLAMAFLTDIAFGTVCFVCFFLIPSRITTGKVSAKYKWLTVAFAIGLAGVALFVGLSFAHGTTRRIKYFSYFFTYLFFLLSLFAVTKPSQSPAESSVANADKQRSLFSFWKVIPTGVALIVCCVVYFVDVSSFFVGTSKYDLQAVWNSRAITRSSNGQINIIPGPNGSGIQCDFDLGTSKEVFESLAGPYGI